jgi:hypothetical protein
MPGTSRCVANATTSVDTSRMITTSATDDLSGPVATSLVLATVRLSGAAPPHWSGKSWGAPGVKEMPEEEACAGAKGKEVGTSRTGVKTAAGRRPCPEKGTTTPPNTDRTGAAAFGCARPMGPFKLLNGGSSAVRAPFGTRSSTRGLLAMFSTTSRHRCCASGVHPPASDSFTTEPRFRGNPAATHDLNESGRWNPNRGPVPPVVRGLIRETCRSRLRVNGTPARRINATSWNGPSDRSGHLKPSRRCLAWSSLELAKSRPCRDGTAPEVQQ